MYSAGQGVTQNYSEALKWFRLAAMRRNADAENNLGVMYTEGKGVTQNYIRGYMWFNLGASKGNKNAKKNRDNMAKVLTPPQIAEAQKMAKDCEKKNYKNCE